MAGTIQNLEILSAGTHKASTGRVTVTEADLDEMIKNFSELKGSNVVRPHLKLGHTEAQKWFGQENGIPVLGWINRVWRVGNKLLADITDVPDALLDMIRQRRYHNVSAEIFLDFIEVGGRKVRNILSAVALLGTEMPAAKDLAGLANALFSHKLESVDEKPVTLSQETEMPDGDQKIVQGFSQAQVDSLVAAAVKLAVAEHQAKAELAEKDLKAQLDVLTKRAEGAEAKITQLAADHAKAESTRIVDQAIKDGKLLPKQRDLALAFMTQLTGSVKFSDGKEKSPAVMFQEFLEMTGKQVDLSERGSGKNGEKKDKFATPAEEVDYKAKQLMAEKPALKYAEAMSTVLAADADLKLRYAEQSE